MAPPAPTRNEAKPNVDPRVVRSRRMLMEALVRLIQRKPFDDISIQEIADEATLNRATFYLHFNDKNDLLQAMAASRFRALVDRRGLSFSGCDGGLRAIALGVCDYLAEAPCCPDATAKMPLESSIIPVVEAIFREGAPEHVAAPGVDPELVITTAAWAIFGAAQRWLQMRDRVSAEEMAATIEAMVMPMLDRASQR